MNEEKKTQLQGRRTMGKYVKRQFTEEEIQVLYKKKKRKIRKKLSSNKKM